MKKSITQIDVLNLCHLKGSTLRGSLLIRAIGNFSRVLSYLFIFPELSQCGDLLRIILEFISQQGEKKKRRENTLFVNICANTFGGDG